VHTHAIVTRRFLDASMGKKPMDKNRRVDPTGTAAIRRRWEYELERRFRRLRALITRVVATEDAFGIGRKTDPTAAALIKTLLQKKTPQVNVKVKDAPDTFGAFEFVRSSDKANAFMEWLVQMEDQNIFEVITGSSLFKATDSSWMNTYIDTAYRKGIRDAYAQVPGAGPIGIAFNEPIHADAVGLIYTRAFSQLTGITDAMDQGISRVLAEGLANGFGPTRIARDMVDQVDSIGITRARVLARTETINAYAEASLNSYEDLGVDAVGAEVEFSSADDNAVCPECEDLDGKVFSIDDARGVIPVHPNCRCSWTPV
jgi:SPP1 gp7 family putative phage head morphogenesis protein